MGLEVAARPASPADLPALDDLVATAAAELRAARRGDLFLERNARVAPIADQLDDEQARVMVGTIDDAPVGYAVARLEPDAGERLLCVVSDLYVLPDGRGVGVGEAMMDDLIAWAETHRCIGIDAMVLPGDRETKNFFEMFGLTARAIVVHRDLGGEQS